MRDTSRVKLKNQNLYVGGKRARSDEIIYDVTFKQQHFKKALFD